MHLLQTARNASVERTTKITAGEEWSEKIDHRLEDANLIMQLVSADFLASGYCRNVELKRAMEHHKADKTRVVPVILRACDWQTESFGELQALPLDAKPVKSWKDIVEATLQLIGFARLPYR